MKIKHCPTCNTDKPISAFYKNKARKDGLDISCKKCRSNTGKKYHSENKDIVHAKQAEYRNKKSSKKLIHYTGLRYRYGKISPMIYDMFYAAQKGKCVLCGKHQSEFKYRLSLEHNHSTGEFRGLCCPKCNMAIAWIEEFGFEKIEKYLRRNKV